MLVNSLGGGGDRRCVGKIGCPGRDVHHGALCFRISLTGFWTICILELLLKGCRGREAVCEGRAQATVTWRRIHHAVFGRRRRCVTCTAGEDEYFLTFLSFVFL